MSEQDLWSALKYFVALFLKDPAMLRRGLRQCNNFQRPPDLSLGVVMEHKPFI